MLRRLIRRAVRSMRLLGVDEATMPTLLTASKDAMKASYPELETNWKTISEVAYAEEDAFRRTLSAGTTILDAAVASAKESRGPRYFWCLRVLATRHLRIPDRSDP